MKVTATLEKTLALSAHAGAVRLPSHLRPRAADGAARRTIATCGARKSDWATRHGSASRSAAAAAAAGGSSSGSTGGFYTSREEFLASPEAQEIILRSMASMEKKQKWHAAPSGGEVQFSVVIAGPDGPEEGYGVGLVKQRVDYSKPESCKDLVNPEEVVIREPTIQVLFDYPLSTPTTETLHGDVPGGGGFTRRHLLACLQDVYTHIYAEEEAAAPVPDRSGRSLLNRPTTQGPYGIWGHELGDLLLTGMKKLGAEGPWVRRSATPSAKPEPAAQPPAAVASNGAGSSAAPPPPDAAKAAPPAPAPTTAKASAQQPSSDLAELKRVLATAVAAQEQYSQYSQEQVDQIFYAAALAANQARLPLAKMAVTETRMGVVEDKVIKNHFASEYIYHKYKDEKTCGMIEEDPAGGVTKVAEPVGVVAGIVPTTNPTSTAIFKALLCLKTRNALVLCPHPRARKCTIEAARIVRDAAVAAGAPPGIISWIEEPSMLVSQSLMSAPEISLILATGGPQMVRAAYSSGNPALGVGAGNTPAVIDETADIRMAVSSILVSKTFDNGVICASEQSVVVVDQVYDAVREEFATRGAYLLNEEEKEKVRQKVIINGRLNADIVGQSVQRLGEIFGINVPSWAKVLVAEIDVIGKEEPLSEEKLSPLLAMYRASTFESAVAKADRLVNLFGAGHTSVLYTNPLNQKHIRLFERTIKTVRVLINCPASQGAIGDIYNFHLDPSLTLGCGTWGSTSVSMNVGPRNLLNIKSAIERRENMLWFRVPSKIYHKAGCLEEALSDLRGKERAVVITDRPLYDMGFAKRVTDVCRALKIRHRTFYNVPPDPTLACIKEALDEINRFEPDVIIALGGGSPMDAAKIAWLMYEVPDIKFEGLAMRFMDIRKRVYEIPQLGRKAALVAIPTTSGTGSEVTPFAVVTDERTGQKYPLADYALTPTMAIIDPLFVINMPKGLTAAGGIDTLVHAIESYVSIFATDYTKALSREAVRVLVKYLPRSYNNGPNDFEARERVHSAATMAGMAFANAFLGICHSMAHKLGAQFHIPHGVANALLISHVIRYNATDKPMKQAAFPQYKYPQAKSRLAGLADLLQLGGETRDEKVIRLIEAVEQLKAQVNIPPTIKDVLGAAREAEYFAAVDEMAENAFDDQCTGANPRYPTIADLRQILLDAWDTPILPLTTLEFPPKKREGSSNGAGQVHPARAAPSGVPLSPEAIWDTDRC
ncbi:bifunctional acetaldehyde- alcohol dehydrogenase isoform A [Chlorella sorokiniana]|uniref:alcohol dehydrogenase n=1 Tax=Chlorella sorokiniana TaxID=3076 RepID=A0A2P6U1H3_CHLSO|nr:bifunctional acetaldehyde- alcohol dehydrogenase isoform A [Chlorella sorokiniana]|eukprot:PRW60149.1 bifunctional acetaldehyde- alcohol dehydrogenase isoform A [Chlorella sorokiniana]